jgi:hypothetical protein
MGFGDILSTFVMGFGGHFVHFCNRLSPIGMYKYVRKEIVWGQCDDACKCECFLGKGVE